MGLCRRRVLIAGVVLAIAVVTANAATSSTPARKGKGGGGGPVVSDVCATSKSVWSSTAKCDAFQASLCTYMGSAQGCDLVNTQELNAALAPLVSETELTTALSGYVSSASLTTTLNDYVTETELNNAGYATSADLSTLETATNAAIAGVAELVWCRAITLNPSSGCTFTYSPSQPQLRFDCFPNVSVLAARCPQGFVAMQVTCEKDNVRGAGTPSSEFSHAFCKFDDFNGQEYTMYVGCMRAMPNPP